MTPLEKHRAHINATPRTEALNKRHDESVDLRGLARFYNELLDHARTLERELRDLMEACAPPKPDVERVERSPTNVQRLLNEAAIHFESFPGGRDGNGMALLYRAIKELKGVEPVVQQPGDPVVGLLTAAWARFPEAWKRLHEPAEGWESNEKMCEDFYADGYVAGALRDTPPKMACPVTGATCDQPRHCEGLCIKQGIPSGEREHG